MVFSSTIFTFGFLPLVLAAYFLLRGVRARNALLLVASLLFYAWGETFYVAIMAVSITVNYFAGILIAQSVAQSMRPILIGNVETVTRSFARVK